MHANVEKLELNQLFSLTYTYKKIPLYTQILRLEQLTCLFLYSFHRTREKKTAKLEINFSRQIFA